MDAARGRRMKPQSPSRDRTRCSGAGPAARAVTSGPKHHFFGYYDKSPWDATGRFLLGLQSRFGGRCPRAQDTAAIGLIDTEGGDTWRPVAQTTAWNWQQGCMLQWHPAAPDRLIVYNARQGDSLAGIVMDVFGGKKRVLAIPVYAVGPRGSVAISLSFDRLARCRPGYGYHGLARRAAEDPAPERDGLFLLDLESGLGQLTISLAELAEFQPLPSMQGATHWVNHAQFNTDGRRFGFLHRWRGPQTGGRTQTRLLTADTDGSELRCVSDHEMVSHYDWRDPSRLLAWARRHGIGDRYYLFTDGTDNVEVIGEGSLLSDGHCSYSPDRRWILTDTYSDSAGMRTLLLYRPRDESRVELGRFLSPPQLAGELRCDLHPRWSRDGRQVCFDSAHEGTRQMYVVDVADVLEQAH